MLQPFPKVRALRNSASSGQLGRLIGPGGPGGAMGTKTAGDGVVSRADPQRQVTDREKVRGSVLRGSARRQAA